MNFLVCAILFGLLLNVANTQEEPPVTCAAGEVEVTLFRTTKNYATEESFMIYQGDNTDAANLKYTQPNTIEAHKTYTWTICLANTLHTIHMTDSYGDGWSSGSNVVISGNGMTVGTFSIPAGYGDAYRNKIETFFFPIVYQVEEAAMWQYSNVAQTSSEWTTGTITWEAPESYPDVSTITRYFRYSMDAPTETELGMRITVTTKYGFRMYMNGNTVFSVNVPNTLESTTEATSVSETAVARKYSSLIGIYPAAIGGKFIFAIELHGTSATQSGAESFSVAISMTNSDMSITDSSATITSYPSSSTSGGEGPDKLFDGNTGTKWCIPIATYPLPAWVVYKLPNGNREMVTKYNMGSANDMQTRDCKEWKLFGSNDEQTWYTLDHQVDQYFASRLQLNSYPINNFVPFNAFKWECYAIYGTATDMQMSEVQLRLSPVPYSAPTMAYPESTYTWSAHVDVVSISTGLSGFTNWNITGGTLPAGLSFNTATGDITGTATETLAQTTFTISALYLVDSQTYTTTLTITVNACNLPTHMAIIATKTNSATAAETWVLKSSDGTPVMSSTTDADSIGKCLAVGDYTLVLSSTSGVAWASSSQLKFDVTINDRTIVFFENRLTTAEEKTYTVSFNLPLAPAANSSFKYLNDGTVPANWYATTFTDSAWTTLNDASRPSTTQNIKLFRSTFNVASKTGFNGFELSVFSRAGVVVYINGNEIYRRYLGTGDISASTTATGGGQTTTWKTITGSMTNINQGTNTIAVGIITLGSDSQTIDFDMYLRLLNDCDVNTRYWGYTASGTTPGAADKLFDGTSAAMEVSTSTPTQKFVITFNDQRAELFNKYCFITADDANKDPSTWTISGSNDGTTFTLIKSESNVMFEDRQSTYCFYMPTNTVAYTSYELSITAARSPSATHYKLVAWNLYLLDMASLQVPELAFTPSELIGYAGMSFPSAVCSSEYYNTFSISPELPAGLYLNSYNGAIYGTPSVPIATTTYTLTALNHLGESKTTTISVAVSTCSGDKVSFTLEFNMISSADQCSFELIDQTTQQVVASRSSFTNNQILSIPLCEAATTYHLKLIKTNTSGWGGNKVTVKLANGTPLLIESLASGFTNKEYPFNPAYSVLPQWSEWNYLVDGTQAPAGWNTVAGAPASWATAMPYQLPAATGVTQYYYKKFEVASLENFAVLDIAVKVKAGAIVYLNGEEIRRVNMPEGDVTSSTAATSENEAASLVITGEWLNNGKVVAGTNILAIELHRFTENEAQNSFDGSAILILNNMYMIIDGEGTTDPYKSDFEGSAMIFDNDSSTKFLTQNGCSGTKLYWQYNNDRREPIARYTLVSANDCNSRHPSGWTLYGSNDGETWRPLQQKSDQTFTTSYQQLHFDVYNTHAFNQYMLQVEQCNNQNWDSVNCGAERFQLAEWYLFTQYLSPDSYCPADGNFPPALTGDNSYADCPAYYEGNMARTCVDGAFGEVINNCIPLPPAGIQYPKTEFTIYQNKVMEPLVPQVVAVEYTVTVFPSLPAGLTLNPATGEISGTPTTIQESKKYTVYLTNDAGRIDTSIYITIVEPPINWVLIGIIAAVAVIVIVVIVVVAVSASKKKAAAKKKPNVKATKKGTPAPKAVAKPKAAVKV